MRKAFTLIELLVVISIVAVLMAVLLPALNKARDSAIRLKCQANLKGLHLASYAYSTDHKDTVPYGAATTPSGGRMRFASSTRKVLFENYGLSNPRGWWCPAGEKRGTSFSLRTSFLTPRWYTDPDFEPSGLSWTTNHREQVNYSYWVGPSRTTTSMPTVLKFSDARKPSERTVWADHINAPGTANAGISLSHPGNPHDTDGDAVALGTHNAMVDGHVRWYKSRWPDNREAWNFQYLLVSN